MKEPKETAYGKIYLSDERYKEFLQIVDKHTHALIQELLEHKIAPRIIALEKTSIYELDELKESDESHQLSNKDI